MASATRPRPHCLDAALYYADAWDLAVFPADIVTKRPYKAARFSNGARWGATRDLKQIVRDFTRWSDAAVCLPTGTDNGFFIVEADTLEGHGVDGIANLQTLIADREWSETRMARSPSGSLHHYFLNPEGVLIPQQRKRNRAGRRCVGRRRDGYRAAFNEA